MSLWSRLLRLERAQPPPATSSGGFWYAVAGYPIEPEKFTGLDADLLQLCLDAFEQIEHQQRTGFDSIEERLQRVERLPIPKENEHENQQDQ